MATPGILEKGKFKRDHSDLAAYKIWSPVFTSEEDKFYLFAAIAIGWRSSTQLARNPAEDVAVIPPADSTNLPNELLDIIAGMGRAIRSDILQNRRRNSLPAIRFNLKPDNYNLKKFRPSLQKSISKKPFNLFNSYCEELGNAFYINPTVLYNVFWQSMAALLLTYKDEEDAMFRADIPQPVLVDYIQTRILGFAYETGLSFVLPRNSDFGTGWAKSSFGSHKKRKRNNRY